MTRALTIGVFVVSVLLVANQPAAAQSATVQRPGDPLWNGVLIGGAAGVAGFVLSPVLFCGGYDDTECTSIVRLAIGLPAIAGGLIAGGVIDKLIDRRPIWQSRDGSNAVRVRPLAGRGASGVEVRWVFR